MLITIEWDAITDGGYEKIYGLPFPFISSQYAFTHHFDVNISMMLIDFLFYFIVVLLLFKGIERIGLKLKTHWVLMTIGIIISMHCLKAFYWTTFESTFILTYGDYYFGTTSSQLHFGTYPW
jgi:hypothetical protein